MEQEPSGRFNGHHKPPIHKQFWPGRGFLLYNGNYVHYFDKQLLFLNTHYNMHVRTAYLELKTFLLTHTILEYFHITAAG